MKKIITVKEEYTKPVTEVKGDKPVVYIGTALVKGFFVLARFDDRWMFVPLSCPSNGHTGDHCTLYTILSWGVRTGDVFEFEDVEEMVGWLHERLVK